MHTPTRIGINPWTISIAASVQLHIADDTAWQRAARSDIR